LQPGSKIHYRTHGSKIAARLSNFTNRDGSGVNAHTDTDRHLALASPDKAP
jgi:hypothetical protein